MCQPALYSRLPCASTRLDPLLQALQGVQGLTQLGVVADDADLALHQILQLVLHLIGRLTAALPVERLERGARHRLHLPLVDHAGLVVAGERGGVLPGALAENKQVRERVAAEPVGAVQSRRHLAGREQAGHARHLRVGVHPHPAHT